MEEKRLTDEEIVKELINESNRGEWCNLNFIDCVEVKILKNALDLINRQKAEIERLTEDKSFATRKMMESKAKAVELQKQVDELTERYLEESKERCEFEQKYKKIQHAHNIGLGTQRSHWEKKVKQAVKDTAKEIYLWLKSRYPKLSFEQSFIEKFGIEVKE